MEANNQKGYTLIEIMVVLMIVCVLTTVTFALYLPVFKQKKIDHFFKLFERDVLFAQTYAMSHNGEVFIIFNPNQPQYTIVNSAYEESLISRRYSGNIDIRLVTITTAIRFSTNGNIKNPGKLHIYYEDDIYVVTFLLGKGRFYVKKL